MIVLTWYRLYISTVAGAALFFFLFHEWWAWILTTLLVRLNWFAVEQFLHARRIDRQFRRHAPEFKRIFGPYGIRIANKAEEDSKIKESLAEVFAEDEKKLRKAVEQLEMLDSLFKAGMRPEGDQFLLHDLKLKYGKHRLEHVRQVTAAGPARERGLNQRSFPATE